MEKFLYLKKIESFMYQLEHDSDDTMFVLYLFLTDSLRADGFVPFLENIELTQMSGNMVSLAKIDNKVVVRADEDVFPEMVSLTITPDSLIFISREYRRLQEEGVDLIEITLSDDKVSVVSK